MDKSWFRYAWGVIGRAWSETCKATGLSVSSTMLWFLGISIGSYLVYAYAGMPKFLDKLNELGGAVATSTTVFILVYGFFVLRTPFLIYREGAEQLASVVKERDKTLAEKDAEIAKLASQLAADPATKIKKTQIESYLQRFRACSEGLAKGDMTGAGKRYLVGLLAKGRMHV